MASAVLITGGNLGDRHANLARARELIACRAGTLTAVSEVMESAPWGFEAAEGFLNQVVVCETDLAPEELLTVLQGIENELGRVRSGNPGYESRTMDIDILFYGNEIVDTPSLHIPHPLMGQRRFVLEPLCGVMPSFRHPVSGESVSEMLKRIV